MKKKTTIPKQKFKEGDIVQHQEDFACYMITYAGLTDTLPSGDKVNFKFWEYIAQPIGFGDGAGFPFESYEPEPTACEECRKREVGIHSLELVLRTNLPRRKVRHIKF